MADDPDEIKTIITAMALAAFDGHRFAAMSNAEMEELRELAGAIDPEKEEVVDDRTRYAICIYVDHALLSRTFVETHWIIEEDIEKVNNGIPLTEK